MMQQSRSYNRSGTTRSLFRITGLLLAVLLIATGLGAAESLFFRAGDAIEFDLSGALAMNITNNQNVKIPNGDLILPNNPDQVRLHGTTWNDESHYTWDSAVHRNPSQHTPPLLIRHDNSDLGINGFKPAVSLYNHNGSDGSTVGISFVTAETPSGTPNSVDLAEIMAVKESPGQENSWSDGGLAFAVNDKNGGQTTAMYINHTGNVGIGTITPDTLLDVSDNFEVHSNGKIAISNGNLNMSGNNVKDVGAMEVNPHMYAVFQSDGGRNINYLRIDGDGTFGELIDLDAKGNDYSAHNTDGGVAVADFDNDGDFDFVHGNSDTPLSSSDALVFLWENIRVGGAYEEAPVDYPPTKIADIQSSGNIQGTTTGDFDNDGYEEIVMDNPTGDLSLINKTAGSGPDTFEAYPLDPSNKRGVASADFDSDGNEDLITAPGGSAKFVPGFGNNTFDTGSARTITSDGHDYYPASGDFDGDGDVDFVLIDQNNGDLEYWSNNGTAYFSRSLITGSFNDHGGIAAADLNSDGHLDLIGCMHGGGIMPGNHAWWVPGNGDGTFDSFTDLGDTGGNCIGAAVTNHPTSSVG